MPYKALEQDFERQVDELRDRLGECQQVASSPDAQAARELIEQLILGYQEELSSLRNRVERLAK